MTPQPSRSTRVPVELALRVPSTVMVTVCVPAGRLSTATGTRADCGVGEHRSVTPPRLTPSTLICRRPRSGPIVLISATFAVTVNEALLSEAFGPEAVAKCTFAPYAPARVAVFQLPEYLIEEVSGLSIP